jgi:GAF domain-containing protein
MYADDEARGLAALTGFLLDGNTVGDSIHHVAQSVVDAVDPAAFAGVTMSVDGKTTTGVFTDPDSPEIDQTQYDTGRGPCIDSLRTGETVRIDSTATDRRYPEFNASAVAHGICSTLSVPLKAVDRTLGALNLYSHEEHGFGDDVVALVQRFAVQASVVLTNAVTYANSITLADQLSTAMKSRETIDLARGIIMATTRCSHEQAFQKLVEQSQVTNTKLRDVAAQLVRDANAAAR